MDEITKDYLKTLSLDKLNQLYNKYYVMAYNIIKYDVGQGCAVLDIVDMINDEIKCRKDNAVIINSTKTKVKK